MSFLVAWIVKPIAYVSVPVILVRSVTASSPKARGYVRLGVYLGCMATVAACAAFVGAAMALVGRKYDVNYVVARTFYAVCTFVLDIRIEVEGEEYLGEKPVVLMMNHQSVFDIYFVGRLMPKSASIMAKHSLQFTPVGPFMTMSGALFIDRRNAKAAIKSLDAAGRKMKAMKLSLWMFPEGTRSSSESPNILPFKKGGFHLAIQNGIPIVPIVVENYWWFFRKGVFETGVLKVRVLPPVSTETLTEQDAGALAIRIRDQMVDVLREISIKVPAVASEKQGEESADPLHATVLQSDAPTLESTELDESKLEASGLLVGRRESEASEAGTETSTEEDDGMVLVGRPT